METAMLKTTTARTEQVELSNVELDGVTGGALKPSEYFLAIAQIAVYVKAQAGKPIHLPGL
jgi:hypothetical protein